MALAWVEPELLFVPEVPVEAHGLVSIVRKLERHSLWLTDDAVTDSELVIREALEGHAL